MLHTVDEILNSFSKKNVDYITFITSLFVVIGIAFFILYDAENTAILIQNYKNSVISVFGPIFLILTPLCFLFVLILSISKLGNYKLGGNEAETEFSTISWIGMLFCGGIGGGIIYWSGVEWGYYVDEPLFGIIPYSKESYALSTAYGLFHWGISAWALYAIPAIALSVSFYKYNLNTLRLSSSLRGLGINNVENSMIGRLVDFVFVVATIGAAGGTIGSYIPMLSTGFSDIFNLDGNFLVDLGVLGLCVGLFGYSVYRGLTNGIKRLSDINMLLAGIFLIIVLFLGPTFEIIKSSFEGLIFMFTHFYQMSTLGITEQSEFAETWTVFYWAWWVAFGPLVALFIARISKGRTLREMILGMLIFGSLGSWLFYMILGGYSMSLDVNEILAVSQVTDSTHGDTAIAVVHTMPFDTLMLLLFCGITVIFITTSYDSMSFVIAYHVQKNSSKKTEPGKYLRLFWAIVLGILPASLIIYSSHQVALNLIILASLPLLIIYPLMAISVFKDITTKETN